MNGLENPQVRADATEHAAPSVGHSGRAVSGTSRARRRGVDLALTIIGELLLTAGVIVALFVGWTMWFNDLVVESRHEQAAADLSQSWSDETAVADDEPAGEPPVGVAPAENSQFGVLHVPRFGSDYARPIAEGTSLKPVLDQIGIGHYVGTQMPGEPGNFALAAHRVTFGKPFNLIADLQAGDAIIVETADGWYTYRFTSSEIVRPQEVEVVLPVPRDPGAVPVSSIITLTSCHPMWSARERFVAYGVFESWQPISDGPPASLGGN